MIARGPAVPRHLPRACSSCSSAARRARTRAGSASSPAGCVRLPRDAAPGSRSRTWAGTDPRAGRRATAARSARHPRRRLLLLRAQLLPRPGARRGRRARRAEHGVDFCAAVARDNVFALPVPPREEPGARGWRCCAHSSAGEKPRDRMLVFPAIDLLGGDAVRLEQGRRESVTVYDARALGGGGPVRRRRRHAPARRRSRRRVHGRHRERKRQPRDDRAHRRRAPASTSRSAAACASLDDCAAAARRGRAAAPCSARRRCKDPGAGRGGVRALAGADRGRGRRARRQGRRRGLDRGDRRRRRRRRPGGRARPARAAVLYTDIARDGMRGGPEPRGDGAARARACCPRAVIASGGVGGSTISTRCAPTGAAAVVVGKALYEQRVHRRAGGRGAVANRAADMLCKRVIPCLDVNDGRVVKGVQLRGAARRGRSGGGGGRLRRAGRRRDLLPRHHRVAGRARHDARRRRAHRRAGVPAADRRRRRALGRGRARAAARGRRQGRHQHRRGRRSGAGAARVATRSATRRSSSRSTPAASPRRATRRLGGVHPRRPHADRPRRDRLVRADGARWARARSCSPAWTATARATGSTSS